MERTKVHKTICHDSQCRHFDDTGRTAALRHRAHQEYWGANSHSRGYKLTKRHQHPL